ncbi:MAG: TetR family transcriptional regulator [Mycolicibacterium cosmeticum]|nr:TetR family transcriptional regulator [Mycolicibacterium cosmeticum]
MSRHREDWLVGGDRRAEAADRILAAAAEVIARDGLDRFDIDALAARVHCSRATVYRHAGGKAQIRDAVLARSATRIVAAVRAAVAGRTGQDRVLAAVSVAVGEVRADPVARLLIDAAGTRSLTASDAVAGFAAELAGLADDDPDAADWIVRVVLSLLFWPAVDAQTEGRMLQRFLAPAFD